MVTLTQILRKLSFVLDFITEETAEQIIMEFNKKFAEMLGADIVDIRWKVEAEGGDILESFSCFHSKNSSVKPKPFVISDNPNKKNGIWDWIYEHKKPVWINNILKEDLNKPIKNKATRSKIDSKYLKFDKNTRSIIATPMTFNKAFCGIYSVESFTSDNLTKSALDMMKQISKNFSRIIKKAKLQELKRKDTIKVANLLRESIQQISFKKDLDIHRSGFMARPFRSDYIHVEDNIKKFMKNNNIKLKHVEFPSSERIIIKNIMSQIKRSHFGIVDITKCGPNVMLELGMMLTLNKPLFILKDAKERKDFPFDLKGYNCYLYRLKREKPNAKPKVEIWNAAYNNYEPIEHAMESFIKELNKKHSFLEAEPWDPSK